ASTSAMPSTRPCEGSWGVEWVLAVNSRPVAGSKRTVSVKVPPVSMPRIACPGDAWEERGINRASAGRRGDGRAGPRAGGRGAGGRAGSAEHDAVGVEAPVFADDPSQHIGEHALGLGVIGMPPASATAGLDAHDVAALDDVAVAEGLEGALARAPGVDAAAAA